ncbi:MFS transporter, partial [Mesorhizobium sp. M0816]
VAYGGSKIFWWGYSRVRRVLGCGWAGGFSRLPPAVMPGVEDKDTGAASGINNAVSRIGGLIAVAAMGSLAAWVYAGVLGTAAGSGIPGFGEPPPAGLAPGLDTARLAASDAAFAAVAAVTALLCLFSAITAWTTVSGERLPWARDTANQQG